MCHHKCYIMDTTLFVLHQYTELKPRRELRKDADMINTNQIRCNTYAHTVSVMTYFTEGHFTKHNQTVAYMKYANKTPTMAANHNDASIMTVSVKTFTS